MLPSRVLGRKFDIRHAFGLVGRSQEEGLFHCMVVVVLRYIRVVRVHRVGQLVCVCLTRVMM